MSHRAALSCRVLLMVVSGSILTWQHASAQEGAGFKFLEVQVLDPEGQPARDVEVEINLDGMRFPMPTDDRGMIALNVPADGNSRVGLGVKHDGFVSVGVAWDKGELVPEQFTIGLSKAVPIGGIVHDEKGQPIAGVKIEGIVVTKSSVDLPGKGKLMPNFHGELATTDADGRWQTNTAPREALPLQLRYSHPDYISDRGYGFRGGNWEQLRGLDHVVVMQKGITLRGQVTDPAGEPIQGAKVGLGDGFRGSGRPVTETDAEGAYRLNNVNAGATLLTVFAQGWAPDLRQIMARRDMPSIDFQLAAGNSIRVRVTDPDGEPIAGVGLAADTWRGHRSLEGVMPRGSTDTEGVWKSDSVPPDVIEYDFFKRGHMSTRNVSLAPRDKIHVVVMPWPVVVSGGVFDAESGEPVEAFNVIQGIRWDASNRQVHWQRYNVQQGRDGQYRAEFNEPREGHLVRIEADGYRPAVSRVIHNDERNVTIDFELETGAGPSGVVLSPAGEPLAGADVVTITAGQPLQIYNGSFQSRADHPATKTDDQGRFTLPFPDDANYLAACLHDAGWAQVAGKALEESGMIPLSPWAEVTGVLRRGRQPMPNEQVTLYFNQQWTRDRPQLYWQYRATTDADGAFSFQRVKAGAVTIAREVKYGDTGSGGWMSVYSHATTVDVAAGETIDIHLGGTGRQVTGKLSIPADYAGQVAWNMGSVQLTEQRPTLGAKGFLHELGKTLAQAAAAGTRRSTSPTSASPPRRYAAAIDEDSGFEIDDVPPGRYQLSVTLYALPIGNNYNWKPIGTLNESVVIPVGGDGQSDAVDVGEFELTMIQPQPSPQQATGTVILSVPVVEE